MPYEETIPSLSTCDAFVLTAPINIDAYAQSNGELPALVMPVTPIDGNSPQWSLVEQPPGGQAYTTIAADTIRRAYRLKLGTTVFRALTVAPPFKIQDVVFRIWPAGKTIENPEASMTQDAKPAPLSTLGWAGTIRERRTLLPQKKSSGNR